MDPILTSTVCIGGVGLVSAVALAVADKFLSVPEDPRIGQITACLPGANCGGCGFAGCSDYARAILFQGLGVNLCSPGGADCAKAIAAVMGCEAGDVEKQVAVVLCGGDETEAIRRSNYNGIADCAAAHATAGGDKACTYGCLGYGSCARICPVNAIRMERGLARVDKEACITCGKCVKACPRKLIKLVPAKAQIHVLCRNKDKGPWVKQICGVGCLGCRICTKLAGDAITMEGFLAVVDYTQAPTNEALIDTCPGHCIRKNA